MNRYAARHDDVARFLHAAAVDRGPGGDPDAHPDQAAALMYAGHLAAGLAIKVAQPRAPMAALMSLVFLPDFLWLGFSVSGLELVEPGQWFDGWSHSVAS